MKFILKVTLIFSQKDMQYNMCINSWHICRCEHFVLCYYYVMILHWQIFSIPQKPYILNIDLPSLQQLLSQELFFLALLHNIHNGCNGFHHGIFGILYVPRNCTILNIILCIVVGIFFVLCHHYIWNVICAIKVFALFLVQHYCNVCNIPFAS